jgi:hypothetical protein
MADNKKSREPKSLAHHCKIDVVHFVSLAASSG